jgi:hypothetical protein
LFVMGGKQRFLLAHEKSGQTTHTHQTKTVRQFPYKEW